MAAESQSNPLSELLRENHTELVDSWLGELKASGTVRQDLMSEAEVAQQVRAFLEPFTSGLGTSQETDIRKPQWSTTCAYLVDLSRHWAHAGFSPSETATFVLSLKQPVFALLQKNLSGKPEQMIADLWKFNSLIDKLALHTTEAYQRNREEIIRRQQEELLELSTPVVQLWKGILAVPVIGTLDSARAEVIMTNLLEAISSTGSEIAILDITAVPTVDTAVAHHLVKTVSAIRLMGGDCIISGIRPQIAQTMVQMDVSLADIITKARLADAVAVALKRTGFEVRSITERK